MLDARTFRLLASPDGRAILARLASADLSEANTLLLLSELRRAVPPEMAGAALTLARLRARAAAKFSRADAMFFTPDALEQASGEIVATWRARRFAEHGFTCIADLGCGVGGDTLALAGIRGAGVVALDRDPLRLGMAQVNLAAYERAAHLVQADLRDPLPLAVRRIPAGFFDPARREDGRRVFSVRGYAPPLDVIAGWRFGALAVKLSPGVDLDELRRYTAVGAGVEFVSLGGELKEAVLWCGDLGFAGRWASRLGPDGTAETLIPAGVPSPPLSEPRAYLYEPDPAVIRAGLLGELAVRLGMSLFRLDETIAYLTGDSYVTSPWARAWPVWDWMPFHLKRLRAMLAAYDVGQATVKKRGSPLSPEDLIAKLKLTGAGKSAVVVLTQIGGRHSAILCGGSVD
ncbi:MAG TPA: class I SAM-dependent methyltransferase [Aggregatilineaceae bacterium]|nr:class I SAM-dependent methyltransferase [Aggregatilineaceae bacterium]